jgi:peptidoglycan hydrolase-like protein with peptidoglycan-binding domain
VSVSTPRISSDNAYVTQYGKGYGAGGPDQTVAHLQTRLRELGFDTPTDGQYGPYTHIAVQAFQEKHGLRPSQGIDRTTMEVLQLPPDHAVHKLRGAKAAYTKIRKSTDALKAERDALRNGGTNGDGETAQEPAGEPTELPEPNVPTLRIKLQQPGEMEEQVQFAEQQHPRGRGGKWIVKPGSAAGTITNEQLQQRLQQLGFKVPITGQNDAATQAAIRQFQQRYGLDPSGGIDAATLEVMQNPPAQTLAQVQKAKGLTSTGAKATTTTKKATTTAKTTAAKTATTASATAKTTLAGFGTGSLTPGTGTAAKPNTNVKNVQAALTKAGYTVTQDGQFGPETEAAVKRLQSAHNLPATGTMDNATKGLLSGLVVGTTTATKTTTTKTTTTKKTTAAKAATTAIPKPTAVAVRHAAEQSGKTPDLEETLFFGFGGDVSHSIKDSRDTTPAYDQPIWTRTGMRVEPNLQIPDSRNVATWATALVEAINARKSARDGFEFSRARAREKLAQERLAEALRAWDEKLHPRGRGGKWAEKFGLVGREPSRKDAIKLHQTRAQMWRDRIKGARTPELAEKAQRAADFHAGEARKLIRQGGTSSSRLPAFDPGAWEALRPTEHEEEIRREVFAQMRAAAPKRPRPEPVAAPELPKDVHTNSDLLAAAAEVLGSSGNPWGQKLADDLKNAAGIEHTTGAGERYRAIRQRSPQELTREAQARRRIRGLATGPAVATVRA